MMDGDHVDCFVGPHKDAPQVYIITTNKPPDFTRVDEQKCMLGFLSASDAKEAFLKHYNSPKFFRSMQTMPLSEFKEKVLETPERASGKIAAYARRNHQDHTPVSPSR